ncbi:MAG: VCBS repeat-containing protein [Planctomycetes bacterium]|nr:VCBS repeat-containing protein [Planctomycetota bacterium]
MITIAQLFTVTPGAFAQNFGGQSKPVGSLPLGTVIGDVTGDGFADIVVVNHFSYDITFLAGDGNGKFTQPAVFIKEGTWAQAIALGDFNGDGIADAAIGGTSIKAIVILNSSPAGPLSVQNNISVAGPAVAVVVADFNLDGIPDIAATDWDTNPWVAILIGNGLGGFAAPSYLNVNAKFGTVVAGDYNSDGTPDLVGATQGSSTTIGVAAIPVTAGGVFGNLSIVSSASTNSVALGDLNADGAPDIAAGEIGALASVYLGNGAGVFSLASAISVVNILLQIAIDDVNSDGIRDLAVATNANLKFILGTGAGGFAPPLIFAAYSQPTSFALGDFNGDGRDDLAVTEFSSSVYRVLHYVQTLGGLPAAYDNINTANFPYSVASGDLNGDGKPDFATANFASNNVSVVLAGASGGFAAPANVAVGAGPRGVAIADLTNDGRLEIVAANYTSKNISILINNGGGAFAPASNFSVGSGPFSVAIGDLNGDGIPDVATSNYDVDKIALLMAQPPAGSLAFAPVVNKSVGSAPSIVIVDDLDGDGRLDLVSANTNSNSVSVLLNTGAGAFANAVNYNVGVHPYSVDAGDLNQDGTPDLATANYDSDAVSVLLNIGAGAFGPASNFNVAAGARPSSVVLGDVTGDGRADIASAGYALNQITIFENTSPGVGILSFGPASDFAVGNGPLSVAIRDFDGDGYPDIITANSHSNNVTILTNATFVPAGIVLYGKGTPGCSGVLSMGANAIPKVNSPGFAITTTNAPPGALGLCIVTDSQDAAGTYLFSLGIKFHVDLNSATQVYAFDATSDASGTGRATTPIPNNPTLVGSAFYAQSFWLENVTNGQGCSLAPFGLVSANGVGIVVQP